MSGIRHGSRLDQLRALLHTTTVQIEHARRNGHPYGRRLVLVERLRGEIQREERGRPEVATAVRTADNAVTEHLARLGVTARDVKLWAVEQGLLDAVVRGRVAGSLVTAYDAAHQPQETP